MSNSYTQSKQSKLIHSLAFLTILSAIYIYSIHVFYYAVNIPNADDFDVYLHFLNSFIATSSLPDKLSLLLSFHNEHILFFPRFISLIYHALFETINFKALIIFGNAAILVLLLLLFLRFKSFKQNKILFFTPVPLIILQASYYEASLWATAALSNFWVLVFSLGAFSFAYRHSLRYALIAVLFSIAASLTQGNGLITPIAIALCMLFLKRYKAMSGWGLLSVVMLVCHYIYKDHSAFSFKGFFSLSAIDYFLSMLGSAFFFPNHVTALFASVLVIISLLYLTANVYYKKNPFFYTALVFLVLTALANTFFRVSEGVEFAHTTSRYTFVSLAAFAVCYLSLIEIGTIKQRLLGIASFVIFTLLFVYGHFAYHNQFILRKQLLEDSMLSWQIAKKGLAYPNLEHAKGIFSRAVGGNIYAYQEKDINAYVSSVVSLESKVKIAKLRKKIESIYETDSYFIIKGHVFKPGLRSTETKLYLAFEQNEETLVFSTVKRLRPDLSAHYNMAELEHSGFLALIPKEALEAGDYKITFIINYASNNFARPSHRILKIS